MYPDVLKERDTFIFKNWWARIPEDKIPAEAVPLISVLF
jgi:hypothetical protein